MTFYEKYVACMEFFTTEWTNTPIYMVNESKNATNVTEFVTLDYSGNNLDKCITDMIPNTNISMKVAFYSDHNGKCEKLRSDWQVKFSGQTVDVDTNLTIDQIKVSNPILRLEDNLFEGYLYFRIKDS